MTAKTESGYPAGVMSNDPIQGVVIEEDHIQLFDPRDGEELIYWDEQEWKDDPGVTVAIANAIRMFYADGPDAIRKRLKHGR